MKKIGLCLALLLLLGCPALAGDVTVKLQVLQPSLVLGEPLSVVITVENTSHSTLDLPFEPILAGMNPAVLVGTPGGQALTNSHGGPLACEEAHTKITASFPWKMGKDFDITIPAGKSVEFHSRLWLPISLRTKPGIYTLTPHYVALGTHPGQLGAVIGGPAPHPARQVGQGCWKGTVNGAAVQINLKAPTGIDAQAYQAFKGHPLKHPAELLKRFPTSTYAACAVYGIMHGFMQGDENMFLRSVERGTYLSNSYPDDTGKSKDGWRSLQGDAAAAWWSKWINIILTNHPDIWFADQLRLKRAVDQVALKNYQIGAADLETLSKEATPEVAQKAQKMLDMMRTKGWIKKEPPTSQVKAP